MAVYRSVSLSFWEDVKIVDDFTPEDRYFYLYLLTNPHTNLLGCYQISIRQMVNETGYNKDTIEKLIERMEKIHQVLIFNNSTNEIYIKNWHKYNWTKSPKVLKNIESLVPYVKDETFKKNVENEIQKYRLSIDYGKSMDISVSVSVSDFNININYKEVLNNSKLIDLFNEYLTFRKENKLSISKTVIKDLLEFLKQYNDSEKEKIIKKAIKNGWKDFYPLENKKSDNDETEYRRI